jgi:hypothetical protein
MEDEGAYGGQRRASIYRGGSPRRHDEDGLSLEAAVKR